ncbi:Na(+)/H(+) antiporter NhaA [Gemmatimonadetes bacterium T265]|nr:Na(+)/H(+) antiporter NhaA [Gemmatimonadetes bacterium T265]
MHTQMFRVTPVPASVPTPPPLIERVLGPFERFAARESSSGVVLLACTMLALAWANSLWAATYTHLWEQELVLGVGGFVARGTLHAVVNDGLMAVFFFLVGLEIKREVLVGELASLQRAALPLAGALGGMLAPAALYLACNAGGPGAHGWGVPMATDIAFALGVLALLGSRVPAPLRVFLAALAIADDIGAVLVIAVFYSGGIAWGALGAAGALVLGALGMNAAGVRRPSAYAAIGLTLWAAVLASGVHATVAGVLLAFAIPARTRVREAEFLTESRRALDAFDRAFEPSSGGLAAAVLTNEASQESLHRLEELCEHAQPPLHRMEHALHAVVAFGIMPVFALANAGVTIRGDLVAALTSPVALGVIFGLVLGKPLGITAVSWLAARVGVAARPTGASWRALHGVSWLGGIGFTMALFVAGLAFATPGDAPLLIEAKLGILTASLIAGVAGWVVVRATADVPDHGIEHAIEHGTRTAGVAVT